MPIITSIRSFLKLDKKYIATAPTDFADEVGLFIIERKELMKPIIHGCFGHVNSADHYPIFDSPFQHIDLPIHV